MFRSAIELMKKAGRFLKYPLLQYIPITIRTLGASDDWHNPYNQASPQFFIFQDPQDLQSTLSRYQLSAHLPANNGELFVLTLNYRANTVLFRHLTCKIFGTSRVNSFHVFALTKKYFPRRMLHFVLYDDNGQVQRRVNKEIH